MTVQRIPAIIAFVALVLATTSSAYADTWGGRTAEEAYTEQFELAELQADFNRMVDRITDRHPLLYADGTELNQLVSSQYEKLRPGMDEWALYGVLAPIIEALECGHSNIQPSSAYEEYLLSRPVNFPLSVALVQDSLVIVDGQNGSRGNLRPGSRLVAINGRPAAEIVREMLSLIPSDGTNESAKRYKVSAQFAYYYHMMIERSDSFVIDYTQPDGDEVLRTTLVGVPGSQLYGRGRVHSSIDLYFDLETMRSDYGGTVSDRYAYLQVGSFIIDHREFASFAEQFFGEMARRSTDRLILDLRGNWGGPPRSAALLLSYLVDRPVPYFNADAPFYHFRLKRGLSPQETHFNGELVVLIDGAVFSTAGHLSSLLRHYTNAVFIGERTGGGASCTDGSRNLVLRNTGLRVQYATRTYSTSAADNGFESIPSQRVDPGTRPDIRVLTTVSDILANRDAVLGHAQARWDG